jgi:hypothetical protein
MEIEGSGAIEGLQKYSIRRKGFVKVGYTGREVVFLGD